MDQSVPCTLYHLPLHLLTLPTAPSNIKKIQARENAHTVPQPVEKVLQAALITGDMAMRNVALRINLK